MAIRKDIDKDTLGVLQRWFKIKVDKKADRKTDVVKPSDTFLKNGETDYINQNTFPPQVQRLYDFWVTTYFNRDKYNNRQDLWTEMENLYFNDPLIARAVNIKTDEVIQADSNMQPIFVEGDQKQVDYILKFFDDIGIYQKLRATAFDIHLFGNHLWILGINGDQGIDELIQTDIFSLTERLEFSPAKLEAEMALKGSIYNNFFTQDRVSQLIDAITNKDNITSIHKKYLLGFIVNNYVLPPWRVLHFRNETTRSPFEPFGVPTFIHALAPYKQYDAAMTFQVMMRAASFPIDKYSINLPNVIDDSEKFNVLLSFIEKLDNIGIRQSKKDEHTLGDRIFTIRDLFDFEQITPDLDFGKVADLDMLKDERIVSTGLPRNIIDPNDSGFGDSGVALIQKWKELARAVFHTQSIILDNITQLVKLQMILTKSFAVDDFNFILSMPFPESQVSGDMITNQKDLMDLFTALVDGLSEKFMGGEPLPVELLKDLLNQVMPYDQKRIDSWIDIIDKAKKDTEKEADSGDSFGDDFDSGMDDEDTGDEELTDEEPVDADVPEPSTNVDDLNFESIQKKTKRLKESIKKKSGMRFSEAVQQEFVNVRQKKMREGILNGKHYFSSKNFYQDFRAEGLVKIDKNILKEMNSDTYKIEDDTFLTNKKGTEKRKGEFNGKKFRK